MICASSSDSQKSIGEDKLVSMRRYQVRPAGKSHARATWPALKAMRSSAGAKRPGPTPDLLAPASEPATLGLEPVGSVYATDAASQSNDPVSLPRAELPARVEGVAYPPEGCASAADFRTNEMKLYESSQLSCVQWISLLVRNDVRLKMSAWCLRKEIRSRQKRTRPSSSSAQASQENQLAASWHHVLLFPPCVRPYSSPMRSMGVPAERKSATMRLRICRSLSATTSGSSTGPSKEGPSPQFHDMLLSSPLSSLLHEFRLWLYETRSRKVKPSCAAMKLIEWQGPRPLSS
mmetsp:Transcript_99685/g.281419  ORF Transcript_99685/g.281419 Transcript_99685/m.281419 type:complete len:291 (-) Transcript_99685:1418-2290(-)